MFKQTRMRNLLARKIPCFIITDPEGLPIDGIVAQIYFRKSAVQTRSEELTEKKIKHEIVDVTLRDARGLLSRDFNKRYQ